MLWCETGQLLDLFLRRPGASASSCHSVASTGRSGPNPSLVRKRATLSDSSSSLLHLCARLRGRRQFGPDPQPRLSGADATASDVPNRLSPAARPPRARPPPAPNKAECDGKKRGVRRVGLGGSSPPAQVGEGLVLRRLARAGWRGGGQDFFFLFSPWLLQCCGTCMGHGRRNWRHGVMVCRQSPLGAALAPRSSGGAISLAVFLTGPHPAAGKGDPSGNWINAIRRGELAIRSGPPSSLSSACWLAVCLSTLILSQSVTARGTAGNGDSPRAIRFKTRSGIARDIAGWRCVGGRSSRFVGSCFGR